MTETATILGLFLGKPEQRWDGKDPSAIRKTLADGVLQVTRTGLAGDQQADLAVHGGPEKALHIYPSEHYAHWREVFPEKSEIYRNGGFGENLSTQGFTEADLCVGDIFSAGSARLQISQGRQPCWKLNLHTDNPAQAASFQKTARTGWYFRVLEEGHAGNGRHDRGHRPALPRLEPARGHPRPLQSRGWTPKQQRPCRNLKSLPNPGGRPLPRKSTRISGKTFPGGCQTAPSRYFGGSEKCVFHGKIQPALKNVVGGLHPR